jgi:5'-nucleotidase
LRRRAFGAPFAGYRLCEREEGAMRLIRGLLLALAFGLLGAAPPGAITVKLIAINDFHGYLQPGEKFQTTAPDGTKVNVPVGGAAYLATAIAKIKAENPLNAVVGAGDMVGASPLTSALFHDEPTIDALGAAGLEFTSVGNHEFDGGRVELLRKQNGGCFPGGKIGSDTCMNGGAFAGAAYKYLAANVVDTTTGKTLFPPYAIKYFDAGNGKKIGIAFIGLVLADTPTIVSASGVRGLRFTDEAATVKALLPQIHAQGVNAVVILIHQGIVPTSEYDDHACTAAAGDLLPILDKLDPSIRLVISGHTHRAYICPHGEGSHNRNVYYTSAGRYGQIVSDIDVTLDIASDTITGIDAHNKLVINDTQPNPLASAFPAIAPVPAIAANVARYVGASAPLVNRVVGKITADITKDGERKPMGESGETSIDDLVAESRLAASAGPPLNAQLAFINGGGVRTAIPYTSTVNGKSPGDVTFGEASAVVPFGDVLYTETLTGAKVLTLLAQQFEGKGDHELLGIGGPLVYTWDAAKPEGTNKIVPGSVKYKGKPIDPKALFNVTVDAFMLGGGDNYTILAAGANKRTGAGDLDAFIAFLNAGAPVAPPKRDHVTRLH